MKRLAFYSAAQSDLREAKKYYEEQRLGLGDDFMRRVDEQVDYIVRHPLASPIVEDGVRKRAVRKFHFDIYYEVVGEAVFVLGVIHQRRHQDTWKTRR